MDSYSQSQQSEPIHVDSNNPTDDQATTIPRERGSRRRATTSDCWKHFTKKVESNENGESVTLVVCNYCGKKFGFTVGGATTQYSRHARTCLSRFGSNSQQTQLQFGAGGEGETSSGLNFWSYDPDRTRKGMAALLAAAELPLNLVENPHLTKFIQECLQPRYKNVARNTARADVIAKYENLRDQLIQGMRQFNGVISFTHDLWSGGNNRGYLSATAHYIDETWLLHKKIIAFKIIEHPHNAGNVARIIYDILVEYGILDKVRSFTLDNAKVNDGVIRKLKPYINPDFDGELFHVRCVCHVINLIVKCALDGIHSMINRIRTAILHISSGTRRKQEFESLCIEMNLAPKTFGADMPIRWNSTYIMIRSCNGYENAIMDFWNNRAHGLEGDDLTITDWEISKECMKFLQVFYEATVKCSAVYSPTSSVVLFALNEITLCLRKYRTHPIFGNFIPAMVEKFQKYYDKIPLLYALGAIVDPRINLKGAYKLLKSITTNMEMDTNVVINYDLKSFMIRLYNHYANMIPSGTSGHRMMAEEVAEYSMGSSWAILLQRDENTWESSSSGTTLLNQDASTPIELNRYFAFDFLSLCTKSDLGSFDLLQWWRQNESQYPVLSKVARDVLTPPASTVASESAFSIGGRVMSDERCKLNADIFESLMCVKDWEDAALRIQNEWENMLSDEMNTLSFT